MLRDAPAGILGTVLVADASSERRARGCRAYETAGFVAVDAASIDEARVVAKRRPDAIVLGQFDGDAELQFTGELRADPLTVDIPILHWSQSKADPHEHVRSLEAGASMYLGSGATDQALVVSVNALLRFRDRQRELEVALSVRGTGVFEWAIPTGEVRWSASLERLHGLQPGGFGGTFEDFMSYVHPDEIERVGSVVGTALESGEEYFVSYKGLRADELPLWIEGHGRVFRDLDGNATKLLGVALDVTSRERNLIRIEEIRKLAAALNTDDSTTAMMGTLSEALTAYGYEAELVAIEGGPAEPPPRAIRYVTDRFALDLIAPPGAETLAHVDAEGFEQVRTIADLAVNALRRGWRFDVERETATALQRAVLPAELPELDGWNIDAAYQANSTDKKHLGGDFYDAVVLDGRLVGVIGDVSGHGLAATAQMSSIRNLLRTLTIQHNGDPARILKDAAVLAGPVLGEHAPFVTAAVVAIEGESGATRYASAGHLPAILRTRTGVKVLDDDAALAPPLGAVFDSKQPDVGSLMIEPGDTLILYTDGVIERRGEPITESVRVLTELIGSTDRTITAQLVLDLTDDGDLNDDDRAVLCIHRQL